MSWNVSGQAVEACSCKLLCPCNFGPADPDQGWCSAALAFDIRKGKSENVDLSGVKVAWAVEMPHDFTAGNATGKLYIDDKATEAQRRELEAIFTGKRGGAMGAAVAGLVTKWLPTQVARIDLQNGSSPAVRIAGAGEFKLELIKNQAGHTAKMVNAPIGEAFGLNSEDIGRSSGAWTDPAMRRWNAGSSGGIGEFSMKG